MAKHFTMCVMPNISELHVTHNYMLHPVKNSIRQIYSMCSMHFTYWFYLCLIINIGFLTCLRFMGFLIIHHRRCHFLLKTFWLVGFKNIADTWTSVGDNKSCGFYTPNLLKIWWNKISFKQTYCEPIASSIYRSLIHVFIIKLKGCEQWNSFKYTSLV